MRTRMHARSESEGTSRRSFLWQMAKTVGVALGASLIPATSAIAGTRRGDVPLCGGTTCISCVPVSCTKPCTCGSCPTSARLYDCSGCGTGPFYRCTSHSPCASFCSAQC